MPDLERSYRRLLHAYPRAYRRDRGLEILTTLMDAAAEGQTRPARADAVHLVWSGLRLRLQPPGRVAGVAAGVVTLWLAVVLSGAAATAAWSGATPPYPFSGLLDMAYSYRSTAFQPAEPPGVLAATIAGLAVGLIVFWPAMIWLTRRVALSSPGSRLRAALLGLPVVVTCAANLADNVLSVMPHPVAADLMYPLANQVAHPAAATAITLGLVAVGFSPFRFRWSGHR